jgi:hypothetical protein
MAFVLGQQVVEQPERTIFRKKRPYVSEGGQLFFAVRSVAVTGRDHILQYAFADERGNVALSTFTRAPSPLAMVSGCPPEDLAAPPLEPEAFRELMHRVCHGATLVAYHRILQGGLLPDGAVRAAAGVECAWRRFQGVARARGVVFTPGAPLTLGDCLAHAGLAPLESDDAALRALAIRALWRWMDGVE